MLLNMQWLEIHNTNPKNGVDSRKRIKKNQNTVGNILGHSMFYGYNFSLGIFINIYLNCFWLLTLRLKEQKINQLIEKKPQKTCQNNNSDIKHGVYVGCSTQLCSTFQIKEVLFDDPQKLGCSIWILFD